jgi:membrane-associated phospholipid phosphatase
VDGIIIYGAVLLIIFGILVMFFNPKTIPFTIKALALFIVIRSMFVSLTHLGPFSPQVVIDPTKMINLLGIGTTADLFFSGHTGIPFLLALIYWNDVRLRLIFLATSATFAVSVLLGHLHYSIDVFAAFFITYTIFHIAQKLFAKDWQLAAG